MAASHSIEDRFWAKVEKTDTCWLWLATKTPHGYGKFTLKHGISPKLAHRMAWLFVYGAEPQGELCHTCDVPSCVRPDHLYEGTHFDNMRDCVRRGRHYQASKTHCKNGHPYSGYNLVVYRRPKTGDMQRKCRKCCVAASIKYLSRKRQERRGL